MIRPILKKWYWMTEDRFLMVFADGSTRFGTEAEVIAEGANPNNINRIKEETRRIRENNKKAFPHLFNT